MNEYEIYSLYLRLFQLILMAIVIISPYILWYLNDRKGKVTMRIERISIVRMDEYTQVSGIKASILNKGKSPIRISSIAFINPKSKYIIHPFQHKLPPHFRTELPKVLDTGDIAFVFLENSDFNSLNNDLSVLKGRFGVNGKYKHSKRLKPPFKRVGV